MLVLNCYNSNYIIWNIFITQKLTLNINRLLDQLAKSIGFPQLKVYVNDSVDIS